MFKEKVAALLNKALGMKKEDVEKLIEIPPSSDMGDYSFPCFQLASKFQKAPPVIAQELNKKLAELQKEKDTLQSQLSNQIASLKDTHAGLEQSLTSLEKEKTKIKTVLAQTLDTKTKIESDSPKAFLFLA